MEKIEITKQEAVRIIGVRAYRLLDASYRKAMEIFDEYLNSISDSVRVEWCMPSMKEWLVHCASNKRITIFRGTVLTGSREIHGPNPATSSLECIGKYLMIENRDSRYYNLFLLTSYGFPVDSYEIAVHVNTNYDSIRRIRNDVHNNRVEYDRYMSDDSENIRFDKYLDRTLTEILQDVNLNMSDLPASLMDLVNTEFIHTISRNFNTSISAMEASNRISLEFPLVTIEYDTWNGFVKKNPGAFTHTYFETMEKLHGAIRRLIAKPFVSERSNRILNNYGILRSYMKTGVDYAEMQLILNLNIVRMENDFKDGVVI